jgi:hypothetical protein
MKKIIYIRKIFIFICLTVVLFSLSTIKVSATQASGGVPYSTFTLGEYQFPVPTHTAYLPVGILGSNLTLSDPQDIFYINGEFYIADSGNKRVVCLDSNGNLVKEYQNDEFVNPTGIYVNDTYLFVADKGAQTVFRIDKNTEEVVQRITKPTSPIYGQKNSFIPTKVAVGSKDSIYIIGEGSTSGIIQVNYAGEFIGYLGINTVSFSLRDVIYKFFVRNAKLASSLPPSPTNIAIGEKGSVLSTNVNVKETFKRLNISGINTLNEDTLYPETVISDVWLSEEGYIYLVSEYGLIYEYDSKGNLLFYFNTRDITHTQSLGLTQSPSGIVTDSNGNLYVLDKNYNNVQIYQRTVFVDLVHEAVSLYNNGRYVESKPLWEEITRQNSSFALAHSALGSALLKELKYDEALLEFYAAKDYEGYSNAYWEIRNVKIQENLTTWVIVLFTMIVGYAVIKKVFKKSVAYEGLSCKIHKFKERRMVSELLLSYKIIKKPNDVVYFVKKKSQGSIWSALFILLIFIITYLIKTYSTAFLFRDAFPGNVLKQIFTVLGLFVLYVIVNYLVSTFLDGEGKFRDIFILSTYIFIPYILLTLPLTLVSNVLTYNEVFIFDLVNFIVAVWTIFLFIYTIKEVHNYRPKETFLAVILILFGIFIVILVGLLIFTFISQLYDFIVSVIKEVIYRVQ